ncbi:hypothetical protein K438DRAFT_1799621 [Mycena galopus ATCC 62051]|nr:hypothetical protein K438DRAFT_1799621 [Mycena galopus ATCC 62051]
MLAIITASWAVLNVGVSIAILCSPFSPPKKTQSRRWSEYGDQGPNSADHLVDLHGLSVREAKLMVKAKISQVKWWALLYFIYPNSGCRDVCFIVGKGKHSVDGIAKLKPAIMKYISWRLFRSVILDPSNDGRIIVDVWSMQLAMKSLLGGTVLLLCWC